MSRPPRQTWNQNQQPSPNGERFQLDLPEQAVSFDVAAIDALLRSQGATLEHYAAILCPLGLENKTDIRHTGHPGKCHNGFIYKKIGNVVANVTSNSSQQNWSGRGIEDSSSAYVTLPRYYDERCDGRPLSVPIRIQHFDRIYIKDLQVQVVNSEKIEYNQSGVDRLAYPALSVEFLIDANGQEYTCGKDFEVESGNIVWKENRAPGYNVEAERGVIYAVRYTYRPFYYVENMLHEIRLARTVNAETGEIELERLPFQLRLQREYAFDAAQREKEKEDKDSAASGGRVPRRGSFGPR